MKQKKDILKQYRTEIDLIDDKIISLFATRFDVVKKIGELKIKNNISVYQAGRWGAVLDKAINKWKSVNLSPAFITHIWNIFHHSALYIQYQQKGKYARGQSLKKSK